MGVGGGIKGHSTQNSSGSGRAGRPYGWMLLLFLAFGALLFGIIALHKRREKRVFDLVIEDKDIQLHSLHLHLQVPNLSCFRLSYLALNSLCIWVLGRGKFSMTDYLHLITR